MFYDKLKEEQRCCEPGNSHLSKHPERHCGKQMVLSPAQTDRLPSIDNKAKDLTQLNFRKTVWPPTGGFSQIRRRGRGERPQSSVAM